MGALFLTQSHTIVIFLVLFPGLMMTWEPASPDPPIARYPDIVIRDLSCANVDGHGQITILLENAGTRGIDTAVFEIAVRDTDGELNRTLSALAADEDRQGISIVGEQGSWAEPGSDVLYQYNTSMIEPGLPYDVIARYPRSGVSVSETCTVED